MKIYLSEYIGTTFLLMIVVGSGIMGQSLTDNNALVLLANTIATGAGLTVLIWMFGNISVTSAKSVLVPQLVFLYHKTRVTQHNIFVS